MKSLAAFLALVTLTLSTANLHADNITATLTTGTTVDAFTTVIPILNGEEFTYTNETLGLWSNGNLLNSSTTVFTAIYTDVLGVGLLNVTDVCADITIIGPAVPCQNLAFSFTDVTLPDATLGLNLFIGAAGNVSGDVANINFDASIGAASGDFNFSNPPAPPTNSPVPEPGTLSLMATGLLGAAGAVRRKFLKA